MRLLERFGGHRKPSPANGSAVRPRLYCGYEGDVRAGNDVRKLFVDVPISVVAVDLRCERHCNYACTDVRHFERGAGLVEFAIASAAFLLFIFGIIEFGFALFTYHSVSNAARLGSRWAIVRGASCNTLDHCNASSSDIQTFVQSQVVAVMDPTQVTVTATWPGNGGSCASGSKARGCPVIVTVSYPFNFAIPYVSGTQLQISSTSQMTIAN